MDKVCVYILGGLLAYVAAVNENNFDHQNYVNMVEGIISSRSDGVASQLIAAKDPLFLLIANFSYLIAKDYVAATFVIIAVAATYLKVAATSLFPGRRTLFLACYILFLSPLFEFEAIRASLAISLVLYSFTRTRQWQKIVLWILAVFSHASVLVIATGLLHRKTFTWKSVAFPVLTIVGLLGLVKFLIPRLDQYIDNSGTIFAVLLPAISVPSIYLGRSRVDGLRYSGRAEALNIMFWSSFFISIMALIVAPFMVTVSFRILQIAWVLYLFFFSLYKDGRGGMNSIIWRCLSLGMIILSMTYAVVRNDTWSILMQ